MIEAERVYKNNCFKGLINNQIFQITKVGKEVSSCFNVPESKTVYVTFKDLSTGKISQTNYDTFIRLQLKECEHTDAM